MGNPIIVGEKINSLLVLEDLGFKVNPGTVNKYHYYKCKCDCGAIVEVSGVNLRAGRTKSCGRCDERNLIGFRSGKLEVVAFSHYGNRHQLYMKCKCDCGNELDVLAANLKKGITNSCGRCNENESIGKRYGNLTVIRTAGRDDKGNLLLLCKCDCGNESIVRYANLTKSDKSTSTCGKCYHVFPDSYIPILYANCIRLASIWSGMVERCTNPESKSFYKYGGRGIENKFDRLEFVKTFYKDPSYNDSKTVDRINNDGNYELGNIRWVSISENSSNRVTNIEQSIENISTRLLTRKSLVEICNYNHYRYLDFVPLKTTEYERRSNQPLYLFIHTSLLDNKEYYTNRIKGFYSKFGGNIEFLPYKS